MSDYTSTANVKLAARLNKGTSGSDTEIGQFVTAASRWVDRYMGLPDNAFIAESNTLYYGPASVSGKLLRLDTPIVSVTSLLNGEGTTITSAEYRLQPRNDGPPYWSIELLSTADWSFSTDGEIELTALHGYSAAVPDPVAEATAIIAGWMFTQWALLLRPTGGSGGLGESEVEQSMPAAATTLLAPILADIEDYRL